MQSEETHLPAWMDAWNHVRDLAQSRGMYFGAGASAGQLQQDQNFRLTLARVSSAYDDPGSLRTSLRT